MRLCLVSQSFLPTLGGAEVAVHSLASEFERQGIETVVLTESSNRLENFPVKYKILHFLHTPKNILKGPLFALRLLWLQRCYKFDVIHFHKAYMAYYALKIRSLLKAKIVITGHGGDIQICPQINYGGRMNPFWHKRVAYAVQHADQITAIGKGTHDTYIELGADKEKIVDIANGANLKRFKVGEAGLKEAIGLGNEHKIALSVGRYNPAKDQETLVFAMALVKKTCPQIKCVFIGKKLEMLSPLIKKLSLEDTVILIDQRDFDVDSHKVIDPDSIPNDFVVSAYKSSDVYVSSSVIEGFPLTLVEAMAAGLPIVATNVWGNEDAVNHGSNGLLVEPGSSKEIAEGICKLASDTDLHKKMSDQALSDSAQYDWEIIANQYIINYKKLLTNSL